MLNIIDMKEEFSPKKMRILSLKPQSKYQSNKEQILFVIYLISVLTEAIMSTSTPPPLTPHTTFIFDELSSKESSFIVYRYLCNVMRNFAVL